MSHVRNLIIGAGPAGLQLAYLFAKRGSEYLVLERGGSAGTFFHHYPRHDKLLSINKVYTGYPDLESRRRYDWNALVCDDEALQYREFSQDYFPSRESLVEYLERFAAHYELSISYNSSVTRVAKAGDHFVVSLEDGRALTCERLFVATGLPTAHAPEIPGIELCENYDTFSVDPDDFVDQRVFIAGKGNSAFETADALIEKTRKIWVCGRNTVKLAWASHYVGHLRAVNNNFLDTYQLKAQNNILDGEIRAVRKEASELVVDVWFESRQQLLSYPCDRVLLCTGFCADLGIFDPTCAPQRRSCGRLPLMTCEWESVNVPNMFFAGTLMQSRDYRKTMSAFIHGFRHNIESLVSILERRDGTGPWVDRIVLPPAGDGLASSLIERISTSAALLLQPGFLADVLIQTGDGTYECMRDVPADYVTEKLTREHPSLLTVTLEYGMMDEYMDPFAMPRGVGVKEDFYIHPIVRRYEGGQEVDRFFLPDDLDNDWRGNPDYVAQLSHWLRTGLQGAEEGAAE